MGDAGFGTPQTSDRPPLRVGVLGTGRIGRMHAGLLHHQVDGATVTAVFDVVSDAAQAAGAQIGVDVSPSVDAMLARDDVDAVAICTSTDTHVELILAAAAAGKAVFCEKPVSLDLASVDAAVQATAAAGVPVHIGFNRRFDPGHAAVQAAVADGTLGDLRQVRITSRDPAPPPVSYIESSGGIFLDMTIHDFDMARFVTGSDVVEVYAKGSVTVDPAIGAAGDHDTVIAVLTHANGVVTTIDNCRQAAYGYDQRVEAFGSLGMATSENQIDNNTTVRVEGGSRGAAVQHFFLDRYIPSYVAQWEQFVTAVQAESDVPVTMADGRAPLVMGLAALTSVSEGRPVRIDEIG